MSLSRIGHKQLSWDIGHSIMSTTKILISTLPFLSFLYMATMMIPQVYVYLQTNGYTKLTVARKAI